MDAQKFRLFGPYAKTLSAGPQSYPEVQTSASWSLTVRNRFPTMMRDLPDDWREALSAPWDHGTWIPAVYNMAMVLLVRDVCCTSDEQYRELNMAWSEATFEHPLYHTIMRVMSPNLILMGASHRFGTFYRGGMALRVLGGEKRTNNLALTYPAGLLPEFCARSMGMTFEAALKMTGAKQVAVQVKTLSSSETHYVVTWK